MHNILCVIVIVFLYFLNQKTSINCSLIDIMSVLLLRPNHLSGNIYHYFAKFTEEKVL